MKKALIVLFCIFFNFFTFSVFSYSLQLINDSPFELIATVYSSRGDFLGQESLQPGEQSQWSTDMQKTDLKEIYDASSSLTPFYVVWKCSYEGEYSVATNISPGATVTASMGTGTKSCKPKPKEKECPDCPPCPSCPACPKK